MENLFSFLPEEYGWILQSFAIVVITLIVSYAERIVYKRLHPKVEKSPNFWDDALIEAVHLPLKLFIWLVGITLAAQVAGAYTDHAVLKNVLEPTREIGTALLFVWFLVRFIRGIETNLLAPSRGKHSLDETTIHAICQILRIAVIITAVLVLLQTFGVPLSGVIAFGGVGGIAVGFAAKDLLSNFFGGLMIFLDRPFKIGDWVRSPDKEIEGTVEHIGWRLTRIRTFDKRPLFVPNSLFSTIAIENPSRMMNRRIKTNVGVRYQDAPKVGVIVKDVEKMLKSHPEIDTRKTCFVNLVHFGSSALEFQVYTFTKTTNWVKFQGIQEDVFLKIIEIITSHGAECAFPTATLHVPDGIHVKS